MKIGQSMSGVGITKSHQFIYFFRCALFIAILSVLNYAMCNLSLNALSPYRQDVQINV